ncbi:arginase family protein [Actinomadura namibiensis]|uniref:arginase family protein n=1 Tax=Actinomadura kijaniata TaxID=46161 RepID=UPI00360E3762
MTTVLCVPQWQGSSSPNARRLVPGARIAAAAIRADAHVTVPVLDTDGEREAGVRALDVLTENLRLTREALAGIDDAVITVGGECAVDLAPLSAARARYGTELRVLWIDAHPDLYTPRTLPSGSFHGMILRTLLGEGPAPLVPEQPLAPEQVTIAGLRAFEPDVREQVEDYIEQSGIRRFGVGDLEGALDGLTGPVYLHVDLDVLDPPGFGATCYPEPDGVEPQRLIDLVSRIDTVVGAAITEHAPATGILVRPR